MLKHLRMARHWLLGIGAAALCQAAVAQTPQGLRRAYPEHRMGIRCAFDSAQQAAFARQPGAEQAYRAFLQQVAQMPASAQARLLATPDVTVPVVMHIIHTGGTDNISDAQVNDAMRVINEDFSKTNRDTADVIPFFQPRYANIGFRFRLAKLDPNGNCTTGITHTYSTDTNIGDDRVKNLIKWDQSKYLNVWICTSANGAGGYAYLPCTGGTVDGIVIRNAQLGSIGTSCGANLCIRSLTHEIGHYFGLPHTWGGSNTPGLPSNCGIDDGIADTPNTIGSQNGCNLNFSPCTDPVTNLPVLANVQNYMDYATCTRMFTLGQRAVMRASLQLGCRQVLTSAANLLATGTNDGYNAGPCAPVVAFEPTATVVCEGSTVSFADYSYNANLAASGVTYAWQFPGGVPSTSSLRNPDVTYPTGGTYNVTLTVTAAGQSGTRTRTGLIQVLGGNVGLSAPLAESFENPNFPLNFAASDLRNWTNTTNSTSGAARWVRQTSTPGGLQVSDGTACLAVRSSLLPAGTQTRIQSPNVNLSTYSAANPPVLTFDRAYALRPTPINEYLNVQFSDDCGQTWINQGNIFPATLNTLDTARVIGFIPTSAAQWKPLVVPIPASFISSHFQFRIQMLSNGGNTIYIDRLAIQPASALASRTAAGAGALRVFPNPLTAETAVEFTLAAPGPVQLRLTDLLGRTVLSPVQVLGRAGQQTLPLLPVGAARPAAGVYLIELTTENARWASKVVIP
ncbi:M43 family zinc metalloprotease [Hymenobacter properus]|uniref:T9SS type A sorting domain-containing protein n=1 Tax=Hymenobacter properus TaxID=2791026 RepID=A0A931BCN5_9BACT|nr:M43 family zinc metalloprotease [Hymenobacter properus]MBF9140243.1 T9SS type A sorting domain-containing protein [Hymenobacter properus]MBR7719050.1 T9SS type A sorting domain-containing protein [Microvirga sp. SRT04]